MSMVGIACEVGASEAAGHEKKKQSHRGLHM